MPYFNKYKSNQFIDVFQVFCKKKITSLKQVYTQGIDLQHKLHKILSFNSCNDDEGNKIGFANYCQKMFDNQFVFWSKQDIKEECEKPI